MNPVYEMRMYYAAPGKLNRLIARFADHTEALFKKHNIKTLGYWVPGENPKNMLIYIVQHESREAAERHWNAFRADDEWKRVKAETELDGSLVDSIDFYFMDKIAIS
jgi:hypothetical protein